MDSCSSSNNPLQKVAKSFFQPRIQPNDALQVGNGKERASFEVESHNELVNSFNSTQHQFNVNPINQQHNNWQNEFYNSPSLNSALNHQQQSDAHFESLYEGILKQQQHAAPASLVQLEDDEWQREFVNSFNEQLDLTKESMGNGSLAMLDGCEEAWSQAFDSVKTGNGEFSVEEFQKFQENQSLAQNDELHEIAGSEEALFNQYESIWKSSMADSESSFANLSAMPIPNHYQYNFNSNNPFMTEPVANLMQNFVVGEQVQQPQTVTDWINLAQRLHDRGEPILATLALEASLQQSPTSVQGEENSALIAQVWNLLGSWQAENENEGQAMAAFEACLKIDQTISNAILNLSICYTNEGFYNDADSLLSLWLKLNFPTVLPDQTNPGKYTLIDHFRRCLKENPGNSDLQMSLGVLFYHRNEMEKAVDCFRTALQINPNDYRLWNRLGATLANSNSSQQAIEAYERALFLNPSYIRARCNLGVSCMHLGMIKQAIEHFLAGLKLQMSRHADEISSSFVDHSERINLLWLHLRRAIELSDYDDLKHLSTSDSVPPLHLFKAHFDF